MEEFYNARDTEKDGIRERAEDAALMAVRERDASYTRTKVARKWGPARLITPIRVRRRVKRSDGAAHLHAH
jgi:hypothetical protein